MSSNGGLKDHENIMTDILQHCRCRNSTKRNHLIEGQDIKEARQILSNQEDLINRLKLIEAEYKSGQQKLKISS